MGWYTTGPGGLEYKYGDVVGAARATGLGTLQVSPRVSVDGDSPGDLEFLQDLQAAVERAGLPWPHVQFSEPVAGAAGGWIPVPLTFDAQQTLTEYAELIDEHVDVVRQVLAEHGAAAFTQVDVSMDVHWLVTPAELDALISWVNTVLSEPQRLSIPRLRQGEQRDGWYQPPRALAEVFDRFDAHDPLRHLLAHALAHLASAGEAEAADGLWLLQPHEVCSMTAWQYAGVVLFRPVDHAFVDRLARAFDVPAAIRERVFYLYSRTDGGVALPPESDIAADDARAGMAFDACISRAVVRTVGNRLGPQRDGGWRLCSGWHTDASHGELVDRFTAAGRPVRTLDEALSSARRTWQGHDTGERLVFWAEDDEHGVADFLLDGRGDCPTLSPDDVAVLLVLLERLDLDDERLQRLDQLLRALPTAAG